MIFFKVEGVVYKLSKDSIVLNVRGESFNKLNILANTNNLHFFKIYINNAKIKDERLLSYITNITELEGKNIICSGIVKKYKYKVKKNSINDTDKEDVIVEGTQFIAHKIIENR
jgi:hypothetical protein